MSREIFDASHITHAWLRAHRECVTWEAPRYSADNAVWQVAVVQGTNTAGRRDDSMWYVLESGGAVAHFETRAAAEAHKNTLLAQHAGDSRIGPCLRAFRASALSTSWCESLDEATAARALKQRHAVCVQAAMPFAHACFAWVEHEFIQLYKPQTNTFVDPLTLRRIHTYLELILRDRPHMVLAGVLGDANKIFYIYDAIPLSPAALEHSRTEFLQSPLIERLMHLEAILRTERLDYIGDCVALAPFQPAYRRSDMRIHTDIFINSCGFTDVVRRLSSATK